MVVVTETIELRKNINLVEIAINEATVQYQMSNQAKREAIRKELIAQGYTNQVIIDYEIDLAMGDIDIEKIDVDL